MTKELGNPHRAAMLALMGTGGQATNTELDAIAGFTIRKEVRETLVERSLIKSYRTSKNGPYDHILTRPGWAWCTVELLEDVPARLGSLGGALYAVLRGLNGALESRNLSLREFLSSTTDVTEGDIEADIRVAYRKLAPKPRAMVRLADLRPLLNGATRADVDEALQAMSQGRRAHLMPDSNRKTLTDADHKAAIHIGRHDNHLIVIEES